MTDMGSKTFRLVIATDTDAFAEGNRERETARILRNIADRLVDGEDVSYYLTLFDVNGNDIGRAAFEANE